MFTYPLTLIGPEGEATVEATVDTAATYSVVPASVLERIGVLRRWQSRFELGDGRIVDYDVGLVEAEIDRDRRPTFCVFGDGSDSLLGAITLESFLLAVDPVNKRLIPVPGSLR